MLEGSGGMTANSVGFPLGRQKCSIIRLQRLLHNPLNIQKPTELYT